MTLADAPLRRVSFLYKWRGEMPRREIIMPNYSMPTDPVGSYNPCWMTNLYGASWSSNWNTSIYGSPQQTGANVLCNCVGWSQGRMLQIYMQLNPGYNPASLGTHLFAGFNVDAGEWLTVAQNSGFQILDHPEEGTVLVTSSHVANVERYDDGQGWLVSESGYDTLPPWNLHYSIYESGNRWYSSYASDPLIIGFFKIPGAGPGPMPGTEYDRHRSRRYRYKL